MLPFRGLPSGDFGGGKLRTTPPFNFDEKWKSLKTGTGLVKVQVRSLCLPVGACFFSSTILGFRVWICGLFVLWICVINKGKLIEIPDWEDLQRTEGFPGGWGVDVRSDLFTHDPICNSGTQELKAGLSCSGRLCTNKPGLPDQSPLGSSLWAIH